MKVIDNETREILAKQKKNGIKKVFKFVRVFFFFK